MVRIELTTSALAGVQVTYLTTRATSGIDYIETAAEMDARRSRSNIVSETFFYRNMFIPRCPHTPNEFTLEMKVDVERLSTEIYGLERTRNIASWDVNGYGRNFPSWTQRGWFSTSQLLKPGAGMYFASTERRNGRQRDYYTTSHCSRGVRETNEEAAAARDDRMVNREKQAVWPGSVNSEIITFLKRGRIIACTVCLFFPLCLSAFYCIFPVMRAIFRSRYERRWERLECTRCANCCTRVGACIVILICVTKVKSVYPFVFSCLTTKYCFFNCLAFEMIGHLSWWWQTRSTEIHIFEI